MEKKFGTVLCDNLSNDEYNLLQERTHKMDDVDEYKIVITSCRSDSDILLESENPIAIFYFYRPFELDLILKAFEGQFYHLFRIGEEEPFCKGVLDNHIYDNWANTDCYGFCQFCFLRKDIPGSQWGCKKID